MVWSRGRGSFCGLMTRGLGPRSFFLVTGCVPDLGPKGWHLFWGLVLGWFPGPPKMDVSEWGRQRNAQARKAEMLFAENEAGGGLAGGSSHSAQIAAGLGAAVEEPLGGCASRSGKSVGFIRRSRPGPGGSVLGVLQRTPRGGAQRALGEF